MRYALAILAVGFALVVTSCATGVSFEAFESNLGPIPDGHGRVFVYRLSSGEGERVSTAIRASGLPIGRSVHGGFFVADLTAGTHLLTASRNTERSLAVLVSQGETQFVRAEVDYSPTSYRWDLVLVPEDTALAEIATTTNTGN
jgi:hypothetical protein